jgi:hypothetical protein
MTTDKYINENKTETFKKGDSVVMHTCHEASFEKYKDKVWTCQTDSFLDRGKQEVVFLEDFSGYFLAQFLKIQDNGEIKPLLAAVLTRELSDRTENYSEIIKGKCSCGTEVNKVLNSSCTMWQNGDRYHYPEDNTATCIFRCKDCKKCLHETFTKS